MRRHRRTYALITVIVGGWVGAVTLATIITLSMWKG